MTSTLTRSSIDSPTFTDSAPARTPLALRLAGVTALGGVFYVHALDVSDKLEEVRYIGIGYIALMVTAAVCAIGLLVPNAKVQRSAWALGAAMAAATAIGFVLTRTTGLPQATDDKGNWSEVTGIWSLICEGGFVLLAAIALRTRAHRSEARAALAMD
jgi:uncharacterized membrane protein YedE/YeeE